MSTAGMYWVTNVYKLEFATKRTVGSGEWDHSIDVVVVVVCVDVLCVWVEGMLGSGSAWRVYNVYVLQGKSVVTRHTANAKNI